MDRRNFLKASFAGFLAAINPFKAEAQDPEVEKALAHVKDGFVDVLDTAKEIVSNYAVAKGILIWGDKPEHTPGCLFDTLSLGVTVVKNSPRADVQGMFMRVIGPSAIMRAAYEQFGDVMKARQNTLKIGLSRDDGTTLWFRTQNVVLNSIGCSVEAKSGREPFFPGDDGGMIVTEMVSFMASGEPELCDAPVKLFDEVKKGHQNLTGHSYERDREKLIELGQRHNHPRG